MLRRSAPAAGWLRTVQKTPLGALLLALLTALLLAGAGYAWGTREPAVAATHERAVALFNAMETYAGTTALDRADEAAAYPGVAVVVARNTDRGQVIVLRITASSDQRNNLDWWPDPHAHYEATRCYRWTDDRAWDTADEVDCPATDIDPARAPRPRPIPSRVDDRIERALRGRPDRVRQALAGLPGLDVQEVGGRIGVAVTRISGYDAGRPVRDCVLGYRSGRDVEVWRPSAIQVAPGEATCDAAGALEPSLQAPPH